MKPMYEVKKILKEDKQPELNLRACKIYPDCDKRRSNPVIPITKAIKK